MPRKSKLRRKTKDKTFRNTNILGASREGRTTKRQRLSGQRETKRIQESADTTVREEGVRKDVVPKPNATDRSKIVNSQGRPLVKLVLGETRKMKSFTSVVSVSHGLALSVAELKKKKKHF